MPAQPPQARKTVVLAATYDALNGASAKNVSDLYQKMIWHIADLNLIPALSTFRRWVAELPLQRDAKTGVITLREFVPANELAAHITPLIADGLPLRLRYEDMEIRRALWIADGPALYDSMMWASRGGYFDVDYSYDGQAWLITRAFARAA